MKPVLMAVFAIGLVLSGLHPAAAEPIPGSSCSTYPAGAFIISGGPENSGDVWYMTCESNVWTDIFEPPAVLDACADNPTAGTLCADGSVYAGLSSDGAVPMYAMPCDMGQTWTGSACTGTRLTLQWGGFEEVRAVYGNTSGSTNTEALAGAYGGTLPNGHPAAYACYNLTALGYSDWYLPARDELNILYGNRNAGVFAGTYLTGPAGQGSSYWSSTGVSGSMNRFAIPQQFNGGAQDSEWREDPYRVRCVRKGIPGSSSLTGPVDCPDIGDQCTDTTIFAGYHPVLHEHLFIHPAELATRVVWKTSAGANDIDPDSIIDGRANSNQVPNSTTYPAFKTCKDLSVGGHSDWYLPSKVEIYYLWTIRDALTSGSKVDFYDAFYWSSTENSTADAWGHDMPNGDQYYPAKTDQNWITCIRR